MQEANGGGLLDAAIKAGLDDGAVWGRRVGDTDVYEVIARRDDDPRAEIGLIGECEGGVWMAWARFHGGAASKRPGERLGRAITDRAVRGGCYRKWSDAMDAVVECADARLGAADSAYPNEIGDAIARAEGAVMVRLAEAAIRVEELINLDGEGEPMRDALDELERFSRAALALREHRQGDIITQRSEGAIRRASAAFTLTELGLITGNSADYLPSIRRAARFG